MDYLNRICQYTRWKIQYIPVNTWEDALQALRSGEVDLVGAAQFAQDRLDDFAYSADSTGRTRSALVTLLSNENFIFEDAKDTLINDESSLSEAPFDFLNFENSAS